MKFNQYTSISLGIILGLCGSAPVIGQTDGATGIEEILVTARKREENLQDVPIAISVMSEGELGERGIENALDLFDNVPGLAVKSGLDATSFIPSIRGVQANETASWRQKVSTFYDGMPMIGIQGLVAFSGVSQVDVLRGPQSAAFGRSTFGGAINYVSRDPSDEFEGEITGELGQDGLMRTEVLLAGPLIEDQLAGLVSVYKRERDGESDWVSSDGIALGGEDVQNLEAKLVWTPTDTTSVELRYKNLDIEYGATARGYVETDDGNRLVHPDAPNPGLGCGTFASARSCVYTGEIVWDNNASFDQNFTTDFSSPINNPGSTVERERIEVEVNQDLANGSSLQFMAMTSEEFNEQRSDLDLTNIQTLRDDYGYLEGNGNPGTFRRRPTFVDESYAELRFASPADDQWRWSAGVSWYDYEITGRTFTGGMGEGQYNDYAAGDDSYIRLDQAATNTGVFFSTQYDFSDELTASLEARYQEDEISGLSDAGDLTVSTTKSFLPRFSLTYSPTDNTTYYFQAAKGNNPAGINETALTQEVIDASNAYPEIFSAEALETYEEEKVTSLEIGVKGTAGNRLRYAANIYKLDWEGYTQPLFINYEPVDFIDLDGDGLGDTGTTYDGLQFNVGGAIASSGDVAGQGIELEGEYLLTDNFSVQLSAAYMSTEYANGACTVTAADYGVAPDARPDGVPDTVALSCYDVEGKEIPTQPKLITALNLVYSKELDNGMEFFTRWNTNYSSKQWHDEMNLAYLPSFSTSGIRVGLRTDTWSAELYGTNIFDEDSLLGIGSPGDNRLRVVSDSTVSTDGGGVQTAALLGRAFAHTVSYTVRRGASFGLKASYKF